MEECDRCGGLVIFGLCQTCLRAPAQDDADEDGGLIIDE